MHDLSIVIVLFWVTETENNIPFSWRKSISNTCLCIPLGEMKSSMSCATSVTAYTGPVARYASYLKAYYKTSPISQAYKWPLTPSTQYINLAIIRSELVSRKQANEFTRMTLHGNIDQVFHEKDPIDIEDVLKPDDGQELRFVLVEGAPGVGKSTFAWELCRRWDQVESLMQYSLVILVKLRDKRVQQATGLADIFCHVDADLQHAVVEEVIARGGERVLLIMDGADECPSSLWKDDTSLFHRLLSGSLLPKATALVTTRPSASTRLVSHWKPQRRIEVLGFMTKHIVQYAESIFGSDRDVLNDFHKYISSSPSIKGMLYIPLNTVIAVGVYREYRENDRPIPATLTQLYSELCFILLQRYLLDSKIVEDASSLPQIIEELPETVYKEFLDLAAVAYRGTIEQQYIFHQLPEGSKALGFTTTSPELHTGRRLSYAFLHLTLQEYFAAFYISQLPETQQQEIFTHYSSSPHLTVMWTFVAGLTHFRDIGWETLCLKDEGDNTSVQASLLRWLYETQEKEIVTTVLGSGAVWFDDDAILTPFDFFALGYCVGLSKCTWDLTLCFLPQESVEMLFLGARVQTPASSSINNLNFHRSEIKTSVQHLKVLPLSQIQLLDTSGGGLDSASFSTLVPIIALMGNLGSLHIDGNPVDSDGAVELLHTLSLHRNLHTLSLGQLALGCDDVEALAGLVAPGKGSVNTLLIGSSDMQDEAVRKLIAVVFAESSLQELWIQDFNLQFTVSIIDNLENTNLKTLHVHHCATSLTTECANLKNNTNLKELRVYDCATSLITKCARALGNNCALERFEVHVLNGSVGKTVLTIDALTEMVKLNQSLKYLGISANVDAVVEGDVKAFKDALQCNQTLTEVDVMLPAINMPPNPFADPRIEWHALPQL